MANPNQVDEVNSGALAMIIVVVALATLGVALVVTALVREEVGQATSHGMNQQDRPFRDGKNEQLASLNPSSPSFVDKAKGLIGIPIERAMELTVAAVRKNPYSLTPGTKKPENLGGAGNEPEEAAPASSAEVAPPASSAAPATASSAALAERKAPKVEEKKKVVAPVAPAPAPAPTPAP